MKWAQTDAGDGDTKGSDFALKSLERMVNLLKAELDQQKKICTPQKLQGIDKANEETKKLDM